jgi:hypothetical protein
MSLYFNKAMNLQVSSLILPWILTISYDTAV